MRIISFMVVMVIAVSPSYPQSKGMMPFTTSSPEANKLLRDALVAYGDVNLEQGGKLAKEAIAKDAGFAMAHVLMYTPDVEQRKQNLAKAESLTLSADEKLFVSGVRANMENKSSAEFFNPLLTKYPKDDYMTLMALFNSDAAGRLAISESLVKRSPKFAPGYNMLGYSYMDANQMDKAATAFDKYISLRPDLANPYDSKGDYLMRAGNYKEAAVQFEKAASLGMTNSAIKARRAKVRMNNPDITAKDVDVIKRVVTSSMDEMKKGNVDGYLNYQEDQAVEMLISQISNVGAPNIRQRLTTQNKNGSFTKLETSVKDVKGLGSIALAWGRVESIFKNSASNATQELNRNAVWILHRQSDGSWKNIAWVNDRINQTESADDIASVRKVLASWNSTLKTGTVTDASTIDALGTLFSSQAIEIYEDGRANVGLGNLKARWNNFMGSKSEFYSLGSIGVEVAGGKAVAWGAAVQANYPKDSQTISNYDYAWAMVLTKESDGQWRILTFHWRES